MKIHSIKIIVLIISMFLINCKSSKEISKVEKSEEVEVPFTSKQYQTNKDFFRAKQVGESKDLATAKKIAEQNAKAELAGNIQSVIKSVTDQYTNQRTVGDKVEYENKFEELSRQVVYQDLKEISIIGEKVYKKKDGKYQYWIAIEGSKEMVYNNMIDRIGKDSKLQLDFDKYQFQKIFNEEMLKFEELN